MINSPVELSAQCLLVVKQIKCQERMEAKPEGCCINLWLSVLRLLDDVLFFSSQHMRDPEKV